jgi:hypothetical protein
MANAGNEERGLRLLKAHQKNIADSRCRDPQAKNKI